MICWNKIEDFHIEEPTALSLGKFDGVHRGHEALIEHLLEKKKEGLKAVVFTFDIPPKKLSSTFVQEQIIKGNIEKANDLLGYPFFVKSEVIHGRQLGRTLGIPTINMELVAEKLLPPKGVYATAVEIGGKYYTGVTNVGCKPTVNHSNKVNVETHILDFSGDLYGYELKVSFYSFIRPEQRFSSVEMLKEQMERDIETSRSRMMSINGDM